MSDEREPTRTELLLTNLLDNPEDDLARGVFADYVTEYLAVTDKAVLLKYEDEQYWIPTGQLADPDDLEKGQTGMSVGITRWIAKQKGIEID